MGDAMSGRLGRVARAALGGVALVAMQAGGAWAGEAGEAATTSEEATETRAVQTVVVTGRRVSSAAAAIGTDQTRNTITISKEALLSAPSGVSGLKMLESLPGFNVQANDALGLYEFGNSVFVRAFNFRQIGFVLDNIPMGRSDQFGGSPIFRYVDNENLSRIVASPGAGDVSLPSYASLGPLVSYFSAPPSQEFGASFGVTFGSDNLRRTFTRLQTGEWNGLSAYVSRSKIDSDLWRGPGTIDRQHIEAKVQYAHESGAKLTFNYVFNDFFDFDTPSISVAQYLGQAGDLFGRKGRYFGYLAFVPDLPPLGTAPTVQFSNTAHNQYYLQAINDRNDKLYGLNLEAPINDALRVQATLYHEDKKGYGVSPEAYSTSLSAHNAQRLIVPGLFAPKGLQYGLSTTAGTRSGLVARATVEAGAHTLQAGVWLEVDDYTRTQARYNQAGGNPAGQPLLNEPVHLQRVYTSERATTQLFLKDVISLFDEALSLELGVKALSIDYSIRGFRNPADYINNRQPQLGKVYEDWFLPQLGVVWNLSPTAQAFASWAENFALPQGADDIFSQASPLAPGPKAEISQNFEIGFRVNRPTFNGAIAAYLTKFDNRLQAFASPIPGSTTTETFFQNVGSVQSHGVELSGVWKPSDFYYFNANVTWNIAEFQDDFSTFAIKGKRLPDNAEWLIQAGVTIEPFPWLVANLSARHLSDRFTNFVNTQKTEGYTLLNAYVDLGDATEVGPFKNVRLRLNLDNLTDEDYLGTINTTTNTLATFRPGSPRTFQVTISADF
jgi:iron complex outermembrane receptor protein